MRDRLFREGFHDFVLEKGGMTVFPRLVAAKHHRDYSAQPVRSGSAEFDAMLGGGLLPGTSLLLLGPSGVGKTTMATFCALAALERGEHVAYFTVDETRATLLRRSSSLGMDLRHHLETGRLSLQQIDPAEMSPGEFTTKIRLRVEAEHAKVVVIDSLDGYLQAMPDERFLVLQMHELLSFLDQQGIVSILVLGQVGLLGQSLTNLEVSYLSDAIVLMRFFSAQGEVRKAISVLKSRASNHEMTIREMQIGPQRIVIGKLLSEFEGLLSGQIVYTGRAAELLGEKASPEPH